MSCIDLHCHILPGLDDGASGTEEMLKMADIALRSGVSSVCATPHSYGKEGSQPPPDFCKIILKRVEYARKTFEEYGLPLKIFPGMELFVDDSFDRRLATGNFLTLNGSRYLLTEFAFDENDLFCDRVISKELSAGLVPVIAHPERYSAVQDNPRIAAKWAEYGAVIQMNKGSLLGVLGSDVKKCAERLLSEGTVHLISSDAHSSTVRTPSFTRVIEYLGNKKATEENIALLVRKNAACILSDKDVQRLR